MVVPLPSARAHAHAHAHGAEDLILGPHGEGEEAFLALLSRRSACGPGTRAGSDITPHSKVLGETKTRIKTLVLKFAQLGLVWVTR